jgi:hypothetical protein
MLIPPNYIDQARVLKWAWSGKKPFGAIGAGDEDQVFGLAICRYEDSKSVYRFSCNKNWEVIQDAEHSSIEEAIEHLPNQYKNIVAKWREVQ